MVILECVDIMFKWLKNLLVKKEVVEEDPADSYDFDFSVILTTEVTSYHMGAAASVKVSVKKDVVHGGMHYSRDVHIRCLDVSDLRLLEDVLNDNDRVFLEVHLYETTGLCWSSVLVT